MLHLGRWVSLRKKAAAFREEDGAATIEAVIWIPVLIFVFALITDVALVFGGEARILRVVQDANRATSIGLIRSADDTEAMVYAGILGLAPHASVTTTIDSGLISTLVVVPATDLTSVGLVDALLDLNVNVSSQHLAEG